MIAGDKVKVEVFVRVAQRDAFSIFTEELDAWWRRGPAYRIAGRLPGRMHLEPKLGGLLIETAGDKTHEIGKITVWEPPSHLVLEWRMHNFRAGEVTLVELWFEARGDGTRVVLEHRGWSSIRADHPVRHKEPAEMFLRRLAMWWGNLLTSMREHAD